MKRKYYVIIIASLLLSFWSISVKHQAWGANYAITDLGTLGGTENFAYAINDPGQIVGLSRMPGDTATHAFLYDKGALTDLNPINSGNIKTVGPGDINNAGQIASGLTVNGNYLPAIYDTKTSTTTMLGSLGGVNNYGFNGVAKSINNSGQAVGYSYINNITRHAFIYSNGAMTDLGSFGGYSLAREINDSGVVVGQASDSYNGFSRAASWTNGTITDLSSGYQESAALGINNLGEVLGYFYSPDMMTEPHGFLYSNGVMSDLGPNFGPISINDQSQIVGQSSVKVGVEIVNICDDGCFDIEIPVYHSQAFLYNEGGIENLNSMIPLNSGWELTVVSDINNSGQIIGYGLLDGKYRAYLLTPSSVPEPSTIILLGFGLIGVAGVRRRVRN